MPFDEKDHPRDDKGRFSSGGSWRSAYDKKPIESTVQRSTAKEPAKLSNLLPSDGSLKDWANKSRGLGGSGLKRTSGGKGDAFDWGHNAFGPLAGKLDAARYGEETVQKSLFDKGQPTLQVGSHMLKRSVATVPGKDVTDEHQTDDEKHANQLVDGALQDIAKRFPNVEGYLKKNPLAEVQARRAMPIWVDADGLPKEMGKSSRFRYSTATGEYAVRGSGKEFEAGEKPGDVRLSLTGDMPTDRSIKLASKTRGPGRAEPTDFVFGEGLQGEGKRNRYGTAWSISAAQESERDHALATTLHEIGHHVMFHDLSAADRREDLHTQQEERTGHHEALGPTKGEKIRNYVETAYDNVSHSGRLPFTSYAGSSSAEWFAEAFAAFHLRPDFLKHRDPVAYRTVKKVLNMRGMKYPPTVSKGEPPLTKWASEYAKRKSEKEL